MSDDLEHASVMAIFALREPSVELGDDWRDIGACDWKPIDCVSFFGRAAARALATNLGAVRLPTCPQCAVLVDLALEGKS